MILLTGATGFLGSEILKQLLDRGDTVVALKRSTSNTHKIRSCLSHSNCYVFDIDSNDPEEIFKKYTIDTIIHTATEYGRGTTPLYSILSANLILPLRLAELGLKSGAKCFINTDSFFNKSGNSYSNLLNYSLSKKSLLIWLNKIAGEIKIINVVLEHIYGPYDGESKFVEQMIQKIAIKPEEYVPLTHGHQKRDFIFIHDAVQAYMKLVDYGRNNAFRFETFELGSGESIQIRDFLRIIKNKSNSPTKLGFGEIEYRADEIMSSQADISKLKMLGWSPTVTVHTGLLSILKLYGIQYNDN
jgi:nucleoside-diphosphate-sugar epimerase